MSYECVKAREDSLEWVSRLLLVLYLEDKITEKEYRSLTIGSNRDYISDKFSEEY